MSDYDFNENFLTNSASSAHDLPRTMTVAGKEQEIAREDMDSAMLSMLAMNQGGANNNISINLGYKAIVQR